MNRISILLLCSSIFFGCAAPINQRDASQGVADSDHVSKSYTADPSGTAVAAAGAGIIRAITDSGSKDKSPRNEISGYCVFLSGGTETPCASVLLILQKKDGTVFTQQRTQADGNFLFKVKVNEEYRIVTQGMKLKSESGSEISIKSGSKVKIVLENK